MGDSRVIMIRIDADGKAAIVGMDNVNAGADRMADGVQKSARKSSKELQSFRLTITDTERSMLALTASTATLAALYLGTRKLTDAASQAERANIGLATTARYAGVGMEEAHAAAKALTEDGLLSLTEASQGLQNLLSRGFSLPEAIEMMNRFKDSAAFNRQASLEFGQAVVSATEGLKNENSILVDNAGVTKNVSIMWKEYARAHGKTVEQLTQGEKRQAEYNGILRETEGQLGNSGRMAETFAGQMALLNQELFEFEAQTGREMTPVLADIARGLRPAITLLREFVGGVEMAAVSTAAWWDKLAAFKAAGGVTGLLTSGNNRAWLKQQLAIIDQAADETKADIFKRFESGVLPDIGPDTGKRRSDVNLPAKPDTKAAKQAENWRKTYADLEAEIAKNQTSLDKWEQQIIDVNNEIDNLLRKPGADKGRLESVRQRLIGSIQDQRADEGMRDAFKQLDDAMVKRAEREKELLERNNQLQEAEIQYQLSLVDTKEAYHQLSKAEAADQRVVLNQKLLSIYEQQIAAMDKATDTAGWLAQSQAIEETRQELLSLRKEAQALSQNMGAGFSEGLQNYRESIPTLFQAGQAAAEDFFSDTQAGLADLFYSAREGFESWEDFFEQLGDTIMRILSEAASQMTMASATGSKGGWGDFISGIADAFSSAYGGYNIENSSFFQEMLASFHGGGEVLPRYHSGTYLAPDERKAILQTGERVLSREQNRMFEGMERRLSSIEERTRNAGNGGTVLNLHMNAIDTQSGIQFLMKHSDTIIAGLASKMGDNHPFRRGR